MVVKIPYGKQGIKLDIPDKNILDIISGESKTSGTGENNIIGNALGDPIKSKKLSELAMDKKDACILVSDITRRCPSNKFLSRLVDELNKGGIKNKEIKVVIGLGIHRKHTEDEKRKLAGDNVYSRVKILDSDPTNTRLIGHTSRGTPVEIFKEVPDNGLLIATGNIEYHYFAGYSGGAKAVMPAICSRNSIQANHSLMLDNKSATGGFSDNPVRQDIEEAGKMAGIDFVFNVILDENKNIIDAVAGKNNEAYIEGIKKYDSIYRWEVDSKADIVLTSQGGYPKDLNLYQSHKALENVKNIVVENGTIILAALCNEGFGEDVFEEWMSSTRDYELISKRLKNKFILGGA